MEFSKQAAIYLQIGDHVCENILMKKWKEGDKIPSVRDMAATIEVNPNTVMRAYSYLQERGIVYNQRGIGYFVSENAYENTMILKKNDFMDNDLPQLFRKIDLLDLDFTYIVKLYEEYSKKNTE